MQQPAYMPYMQMMGLPAQYCPMMMMPQQELENMYPKVYYVIYPVVVQDCDMMEMTYGKMYTPTSEQLESMIDKICEKLESEVDDLIKQEMDKDDRQFGFGGRGLFRSLISILLIRELLRRRRPYGGYPGYYGGYGYGPYGGYGGY